MNWFCAIRMAKIKLLQETFPERPLEKVRREYYYYSAVELSFNFR